MSDEKDKPVFVISIAAKLCEVHPQTLRMYERKGLIHPKRLRDRRLYSEADIARLRLIQALTQDEGINLAGVKHIINLQRDLENAADMINKLENEMGSLRKEMIAKVRELLRKNPNQIEKVKRGELVRFKPKTSILDLLEGSDY